MNANDFSFFMQNNTIGLSYSDYLLAYRKEVGRIMKTSKKNSPALFKEGLSILKRKRVITESEEKILLDCIMKTIEARLGKGDIKKTLIALQNTSAKAIVENSKSTFFINYINLCMGLVREAGEKLPSPPKTTVMAKTTTLPGGSAEAILMGAIAGAVIGEGIGGLAGAIIGGIIGGLVGASNDVDVTVNTDPQGGGGPA